MHRGRTQNDHFRSDGTEQEMGRLEKNLWSLNARGMNGRIIPFLADKSDLNFRRFSADHRPTFGRSRTRRSDAEVMSLVGSPLAHPSEDGSGFALILQVHLSLSCRLPPICHFSTTREAFSPFRLCLQVQVAMYLDEGSPCSQYIPAFLSLP